MLESDVTRRISMERVSQSAWLKMEDAPDSSTDVETGDEKSEQSNVKTTAAI